MLVQCTEYSVLTVLYWKHMTTEACVYTPNRFDPDFRCMQSFILLVFLCFYVFFSVLSVFWNFRHQKSCFPWNSVCFHFFPQILWIFHIMENWGLYRSPIHNNSLDGWHFHSRHSCQRASLISRTHQWNLSFTCNRHCRDMILGVI